MPTEDVSSKLEQLSARVAELERRLSTLEHPSQAHSSPLESPAAPATTNPGSGGALSAQPQPGVFSVFGRAVLGIAGAYVLRAAAESGAIPSWMAVTLALVYAAGWLTWAAWPRTQTQLARASYAITAALILAPMLWEVTVRFRILDPPVTAGVLAGIRASGNGPGLAPGCFFRHLGGNAHRSDHGLNPHGRHARSRALHIDANEHRTAQRIRRQPWPLARPAHGRCGGS